MNSDSFFGIVGDLAHGSIEPPADSQYPDTDRWTWIGELYANSEWGLITVFPNLSTIAVNRILQACRAMAARTSDLSEWQAVDALAHTGMATSPAGGLSLAWSAVLDTCTDAFDHLAGRTFSGIEAILGAVEAVRRERSEAGAAAFAANAIAAWNRQLDARTAGAA